MNTYDPTNEYDVLLRIFRFIRDYHTSTYPISSVCKSLLQYLNEGGDEAKMIDGRHNGYKIIQVNDHKYRIIRWPDWTHYDVLLVA